MALRFYNEHKSLSDGIEWDIEIHDSVFVGDPTRFKTEAGGVDIAYRADGDDVFAPIVASSATFVMMIQDETHEDLITDLAGAKEGRFTVVLSRDGVFYWAGVINSEDLEFEDQHYPFAFKITAVDGLALLKNYEYRQDGTADNKWELRFEGFDRLVVIIDRCIKKLPHIATHFTGASKFIVTAVNWYSEEDEEPVTDDYDPFYHKSLDNRAFGTGQSTGNGKFLSCFDVIKEILTLFNARIALYDGYFLIEQLEHRAFTIGADANFSRYYGYTPSAPTANTDLTELQEIGSGTVSPKLTGGTYSFLPPLRSCRVTQQVTGLQNLVGGAFFNSDNGSYNAGVVFGNGIDSILQFKGTIAITLESSVFTANMRLYIRFGLIVLLDGKYLVYSTEASQNGTLTSTPYEWSASPGVVDIFIWTVWDGTQVEVTSEHAIKYLFQTDTDFDQGDLTVLFVFNEILTYNPLAPNTGSATVVDPDDYTLEWQVPDPYFVILNKPKAIVGIPQATSYPKSITYEVIGEDENTEVEEVSTILGGLSPKVVNQWGALLHFDDPDYVYAGLWGARDGTRDRPIIQLLAQRIMAALYFPRKVLRGTAAGNTLVVQTPIEERSETYIIKNGVYNTERDELSGEWVRYEYTAAEFTYAPVEYDAGDYDPQTPGGGSSNNGGGGSSSPPGTDVSIYTNDGDIPASTTRTVKLADTDTELIVTDSADDEILSLTDTEAFLQRGEFIVFVNSSTGRASMQNFSAASGEFVRMAIDDGASANSIVVEAARGILLQSTGDSIEIEGITRLTDIITTATINANQNDYAALDGANVGRLDASTAVNITGLDSGLGGRIIAFLNRGANPITLTNADTGSAADNRFDSGRNYAVRSKRAGLLIYDDTDDRWLVCAMGDLSYFNEAYTTSTATTTSLTSDTPATNVGVALVPKGTGAFTLAVPDGTTTGGDARGTNAIDLQTSRDGAAQVASGSLSGLFAGRRNTASATAAVCIGGADNTASGNGAAVLGGYTGFAAGGDNIASGTNSVIIGGVQNRATADASFTLGTACDAGGQYSLCTGSASKTTMQGQYAHANGSFASTGDAQLSFFTIYNAITGTAQTELFLNGTALQAILPATNRIWNFRVDVVGVCNTAGNGVGITAGDVWASWHVGAIKRLNTTTSLVGTVQLPAAAQSDASMATTVVTIDADDSTEALRIRITPPTTTGTTSVTRWVATVHLTEVAY